MSPCMLNNITPNTILFLKGILLPIFCIDINKHINSEWKIMQVLLKNYFLKMLKFLLTFFIDIITPVISSTQIACDVMCVQHVIQ